jgi:pSer/pThr/pTyr-binding forkhead associated (FHA) protein
MRGEMPLRLRVIPSASPAASPTGPQGGGDGRGPTAERTVDFGDDVSEVRIGRRSDLELPLPFSILSSVHARLLRAQGPGKSGWLIEDLGSRNGTLVDGVPLPPGEKRPVAAGARFSLAHIDVIFEGPAAAPVSGTEKTATIARRLVSDLFAAETDKGLPSLIVISGAPEESALQLAERDRKYVVGRVDGCDLKISVEAISREHAAFTRRSEGVFVTDMGSKNGVRVNGVRVTGGKGKTQRLRDGDLVQMGPVSLRLFDPEDRYLKEIEARDEGEGASARGSAASAATPSGPAPSRFAAPKAPVRTDLHPLVAGALAEEPGPPVATRSVAAVLGIPSAEQTAAAAPERSVVVTHIRRTRFLRLGSGTNVATMVAAFVLAVIAAVTVALVFG